MVYSYGARVDNNSNAITVIDEENETASEREVVDNKISIVLGNEGAHLDGFGFSDYYAEISEATLSGDVTFDSELYTLIVTGDCTITADLLEQ